MVDKSLNESSIGFSKRNPQELKDKGLGFAKVPIEDTEAEENENLKIKNERKHEIYSKTMYIPFDKSKLIDSVISSSLFLQKLLYYNFFYTFIYAPLLFTAAIIKSSVFGYDMNQFTIAFAVLWIIIEYLRLYFGYKGNISESFPDILAFLILTFFLQFPLLAFQIYFYVKFPIEIAGIIFIVSFTATEFLWGLYSMIIIVKAQQSYFELRSAPILDPSYVNCDAVKNMRKLMTSKEIEYFARVESGGMDVKKGANTAGVVSYYPSTSKKMVEWNPYLTRPEKAKNE